jgi:hypothetical protein
VGSGEGGRLCVKVVNLLRLLGIMVHSNIGTVNYGLSSSDEEERYDYNGWRIVEIKTNR